MTINVDSRVRLLRNRDEIQCDYSVNIYFPKNKVRGQYQDIVIKGGPASIEKAKRRINTILIDWQEGYDKYAQKKAENETYKRRQRHFWKARELEQAAEDKKMSPDSKNMFQVLDAQEAESKKRKRSWASVVETPMTKQRVVENPAFEETVQEPSFAWGDEQSDEE